MYISPKQLYRLKRSRDFQKVLSKHGICGERKNGLLTLILFALVIYLIFKDGNLYLIIGLAVLLVLVMIRK